MYETAERKYGGDIDELVSESIFAFWCYEKSGKDIEYPKGLLDAILRNKYNDQLRVKYRSGTMPLGETSERFETGSENDEEYAAVRREIGRLLRIYRDVVVRHYMHGQSVEEIAGELGLPKGTVLSRLSSARVQIREGLQKMEKYAEVSYEPKEANMGIYGSDGLDHEPFSLLSSPVEANILICAYERPVSLRGLADTLGMPTAYIEPIAEKLVRGELLGQTPSGLVYTRCHVENYEDSFGDIAYAEELAAENAVLFGQMAARAVKRFEDCSSFEKMNEKKKATLILCLSFIALTCAAGECSNVPRVPPEELPLRPNGGRWLATLSVYDRSGRRNHRYDCSGPLTVSYRVPEKPGARCRMKDTQSPFGDAHWGYPMLGKNYAPSSILRFYASFLPSGIKTDHPELFNRLDLFEKWRILRRDENGNVQLDLPALTYAEDRDFAGPALDELQKEIKESFEKGLKRLWEHSKCRVPKHVDRYETCKYSRVATTYAVAQMRACVEQGLFPYTVEIGKTPLIYLVYEEEK